ncbi:serine/threonine-protein kinase [Actinokineospora sp. NBRC 105648]|uniref:serine/threonine-protein kinase n=1 Tax=Actinokineospora sp. NBRC 105648 TaxID=3032206 RepID=UPI00249F9C3B|nr:serine/threonine-protein kinase [Actinokineospora sp. NBRC 105648]GLZ40600.1 hypothetical protein Acsp05_42240 [Actinokineospora sp. NBRC 105648]
MDSPQTGDQRRQEVPQIPGYENLTEIGQGGSATVYRAWQGDMREVAVKVFSAPLTDPGTRKDFQAECKTVAEAGKIRGFVTFFDKGFTTDHRPYLAMELCAGSLGGTIEGGRRPAPEAVARIGAEVATALATFHRYGKRHGDISPSNILLTEDGEARLSDFGLTSAENTQDAATWEHAAPEVWRNNADQKSDVYGLGSSLFTVLNGAPPVPRFLDEPQLAYGRRALMRTVRVADLPGVPSALAEVVVSMLAADHADRPGAARAAERLSALAGDTVVRAPGQPASPVVTTNRDPGAPPWAPQAPPPPSAPGAPATTLRETAPPATARKKPIALLVGAGALVAVVVAGGAYFALRPPSTGAGAVPTTLTKPPDIPAPVIALADPVDHQSTVDLSWTGPPEWEYAVVIAEQGAGGPAVTKIVYANTTYTATVDPTKTYCFLVQGSPDGKTTGESVPKGIRGGSCVNP